MRIGTASGMTQFNIDSATAARDAVDATRKAAEDGHRLYDLDNPASSRMLGTDHILETIVLFAGGPSAAFALATTCKASKDAVELLVRHVFSLKDRGVEPKVYHGNITFTSHEFECCRRTRLRDPRYWRQRQLWLLALNRIKASCGIDGDGGVAAVLVASVAAWMDDEFLLQRWKKGLVQDRRLLSAGENATHTATTAMDRDAHGAHVGLWAERDDCGAHLCGHQSRVRSRPPRHRADAVAGTTSRRWRGNFTPSYRRSYGDGIA